MRNHTESYQNGEKNEKNLENINFLCRQNQKNVV